jgi:hypothetical protein
MSFCACAFSYPCIHAPRMVKMEIGIPIYIGNQYAPTPKSPIIIPIQKVLERTICLIMSYPFVVSFVCSRSGSERQQRNATRPTSPSLLQNVCSNGTALQLGAVDHQYSVIVCLR